MFFKTSSKDLKIMIPANSFMASICTAQKFAAIGKSVIAKPNTVLNELNSKIALSLDLLCNELSKTVDAPEGITVDDFYNSFSNTATGLTGGDVTEVTSHDTYIENVCNDISKYVSAHISYAKNTVSPVVMYFLNDLQIYLQSFESKKAEESLSILEYDLPELLLDESFLDGIKHVDGRQIIEASKVISLSGKTHDELIALLLTGNSSYNKAIMPWASHLDPEFLNTLWFSFFTRLENAGSIDYRDLQVLPVEFRADAALVLYLLADALIATPDTTIDGMNLKEYKQCLEELKEFASGVMWASVNKFNLFIKNKTLILSNSFANKTAVVYKPIYNAWLESGGTPEIILGIVSGNRTLSLVSAIDASAIELKKAWDSYTVYYTASEANMKINYFKDHLRILFNSTLVNAADAVKDYSASHPGYYERATKLLENYLDTVTFKDLDNVQDVALQCVGKCAFYFTDAFGILHNIEQAHLVNPNIDVREAALLAAIMYVTDYVADQMVLA